MFIDSRCHIDGPEYEAYRVQLRMRGALAGASISTVSEPRAVATGSYAQLSINSYFVSYFLIRSLPLAVLTRFVATLTFNYTHPDYSTASTTISFFSRLRTTENTC